MDDEFQARLGDWLRTFGFTDHPFLHTEAEQDSRLHEYFVEPACFDTILGTTESPQSAVLFASRGGGKTANRVMVDYFCEIGERLERPVFSISYTNFDCLVPLISWESHSIRSQVNIHHHLAQILRTSANEIVEDLVARRLVLNQANSSVWRPLLRILAIYTTEEDLFRILELLRDLGLSSDGLDDNLWTIHTQSQDSSINTLSDFRSLVGAFVELGVSAIYVLVDRIDEFHPASFDPMAGALFLSPLLSHLPLLEMDHVAFKFFLPSHMKSTLLDKGFLRPDRLLVEEVVWSNDDLLDILHSRLYVFSERRIPTLEPLFVSSQLAQEAERRLVSQAEGSPRDLVLACRQLFTTHVQHFSSSEELRIGQTALDRAIDSFLQERARWRPTPSRRSMGFHTQ